MAVSILFGLLELLPSLTTELFWTSMDIWISMNIYGCPLISMDIHEDPWRSTDIHGHPWISVDIHGHPWRSMDIHGYPWISKIIGGLLLLLLLLLLGRLQSVSDLRSSTIELASTQTRLVRFSLPSQAAGIASDINCSTYGYRTSCYTISANVSCCRVRWSIVGNLLMVDMASS